MNKILDFRNVDDIVTAHEIIKEELKFPYYYGKNLDALNDCLSELDKNVHIYILTYEDTFDGFENILKVFDDNQIDYEIVIAAGRDKKEFG